MTRERQLAAGFALAGVGIVAWAVLARVVWPVGADAVASTPVAPWPIGDGDLDTIESFRALTRDLRWAGMLLALGGLLLIARWHARRLGLTVGMLAWVWLDFALEDVSVRGWLVAGACAVVVTGGFLVLLLFRAGVAEPTGPWPLVYSAASLGGAAVMFANPPVASPLPVWATPFGLVVALLLVVVGVLHLLLVGGFEGSRPAAVGIGAVAVVIVVASYYLAAGTDELLVPMYYDDGWLNVAWFTAPAVLALACAMAAGAARPSSLPAWVAAILIFAPLTALVGAVGVFLAAVVEGTLRGLAHREFSSIPALLAGALAGGLLALLAVLPRALPARRPQQVQP